MNVKLNHLEIQYMSQNRGEEMEENTFIDLFAGAGGLSEGFMRKGFIPIAHVENNRDACLTLKTRMAYHYLSQRKKELYRKYITNKITREDLYMEIPAEVLRTVIHEEISEKKMKKIFKHVQNILHSSEHENVDVIIGGPPCQAYSLVGRARDPYNKEKDPRNHLYKLYAQFLKSFSPRIFIFENVPGIISAGNGELFRDVQNYIQNAGYKMEYRILDSYDFGVLQRRRRVILLGWKCDSSFKYPECEKTSNGYFVRDVLEDLPPLRPGESMSHGEYAGPSGDYLRKFGIRKEDDLLTLHIARPHNERDLEIYKIAIEMWRKERKRLKYSNIPAEYKTHKNTESFLDRYKVVADDLPYSHTIVAHIAKDGHYYIHPDINQVRSLSIREAARLQSFPDNYYFEGSRTSKFMQIGNAVPPLMAEKIAEKINKML